MSDVCAPPVKQLEACLFQMQNAALELARQLGEAEASSRGLRTRLAKALWIVREQANEPSLWCVAENIVEAHHQQELRRLHAAIEGEDWP